MNSGLLQSIQSQLSQGSMMFMALSNPSVNPIRSSDFQTAQNYLGLLHNTFNHEDVVKALAGEDASQRVVSLLDLSDTDDVQKLCKETLQHCLTNLCDYICRIIKITKEESPTESQRPLRNTQLGLIGDYLNFLDGIFAASFAKGKDSERHRILTALSQKIDAAMDVHPTLRRSTAGAPGTSTHHTRLQELLVRLATMKGISSTYPKPG